ncbi:hypothetical protein DH86_00002065 [Scytalidium sp. 3C]|nr:hypothetical protein DH86_00002065 [Scytalidium sp. 3C]
MQKGPDVPVPSKAATLAWQSVTERSSKDKVGRSLDPDANRSTSTLTDIGRRHSGGAPRRDQPSSSRPVRYDSTTRTLVSVPPDDVDLLDSLSDSGGGHHAYLSSNNYPFPPTDPGQPGAVAGSMLSPSAVQDLIDLEPIESPSSGTKLSRPTKTPSPTPYDSKPRQFESVGYPTYLNEYPETSSKRPIPTKSRNPAVDGSGGERSSPGMIVTRKPVANVPSPRYKDTRRGNDDERRLKRRAARHQEDDDSSSPSLDEGARRSSGPRRQLKEKQRESEILAEPVTPTSEEKNSEEEQSVKSAWKRRTEYIMKHLPSGVDETAAKQILNEIVVQGDEVHWEDVAGLEIAKTALKETVVYPFLRPDLFMGLREPARGMLLFGPPGTGKTMLARAVATESRSTFFSISASSLTSKYLGESEKLVRALFSLAKMLSPSIIFVDEIDSLLSARSGSGEHEATRRIKTEFLIQWSDLQRAAAGREQTEKDKEKGDASRVLVLAATNLPWAIDEAARRRFVRRQYIPLPEDETRAVQLRTLLSHQKHNLTEDDIQRLVRLTDGSDITALAKDAAMGPLRALGEALLHMSMDEIRPMELKDFQASLVNIRPSVSKQGLKEYEDWAKEFGERGG